MEIKFSVNDKDTLDTLQKLSAREFMLAWTTAVKNFTQNQARNIIGGNFGDLIARRSILTDTSDDTCHEIYAGGENGYIAEHIHTGGVIRPNTRKALAIPVDSSVKGMYPREYPGELVKFKAKDGRAYLGKPMKRKVKPLWLLQTSVTQKPRPWWPDDAAVMAETVRFFAENF